MVTPSRPGVLFYVVTGSGFFVCIVARKTRVIGDLCYVSENRFEEVPSLAAASSVVKWRWPVFLPVTRLRAEEGFGAIGRLEVPPSLIEWPLMRARVDRGVWCPVSIDHSGIAHIKQGAASPRMPIYGIINGELLKQRLVSGWTPGDSW